MKIMQRVDKLERSGILAVTAPVLERFKAALDEAAHRLMGSSRYVPKLRLLNSDPLHFAEAYIIVAPIIKARGFRVGVSGHALRDFCRSRQSTSCPQCPLPGRGPGTIGHWLPATITGETGRAVARH